MIQTVAILAGGLATRLGPLTQQRPKVLIEVAGRPFAEHQLALLRGRSIRHVIFCVGHFGHQVETYVGDGARHGLRVTYVHDGPALLGTGGAIRRALPQLGEVFFVMYGDSYLECDFESVGDAFQASGRLGLMTVFPNAGQWDASNVLYRDGRIVKYDKRYPDPSMRHIDYGLGAFRAEAFSRFPQDSPFDLTSVYQDLLAEKQLASFEVGQRFYEIGSVAGLAETDTYLRQRNNAHDHSSSDLFPPASAGGGPDSRAGE